MQMMSAVPARTIISIFSISSPLIFSLVAQIAQIALEEVGLMVAPVVALGVEVSMAALGAGTSVATLGEGTLVVALISLFILSAPGETLAGCRGLSGGIYRQ